MLLLTLNGKRTRLFTFVGAGVSNHLVATETKLLVFPTHKMN